MGAAVMLDSKVQITPPKLLRDCSENKLRENTVRA